MKQDMGIKDIHKSLTTPGTLCLGKMSKPFPSLKDSPILFPSKGRPNTNLVPEVSSGDVRRVSVPAAAEMTRRHWPGQVSELL